MAKSQPLRRETLRVFAAADRGMAMGHVGGKVAFVPLAAPGDLVEVEVVREKRRHVETRLLRVVEPSPLRRTPPCPHFGTCGGCQWQHLPYSEQLAAKARSFQGFVRSRLRLDQDRFRAAIPSPSEWGYRNRVGLKVRQVGSPVLLGFFARGSRRLVPVETCPVAHPTIASFIPIVRDFLQGFAPAKGFLPQVDVQVDGREALWVVLHMLRRLSREERRQMDDFLHMQGVAGAHLQAGRKATLTPLGEGENKMSFTVEAGRRGLQLQVSPGGFVQANAAVNQTLVDEVLALATLYRGRSVLDLYCGAGNFTLPMALEASRVVGVEGYAPAARDARENARRNQLPQVRTLPMAVRQALEVLTEEGFRPRFALLDPPREGAAEAMEPLARLAPDHVAYVSCSPPTLVRDIKILLGLGYHVEWTRLADMFPQTAHVESLTLLSRRL